MKLSRYSMNEKVNTLSENIARITFKKHITMKWKIRRQSYFDRKIEIILRSTIKTKMEHIKLEMEGIPAESNIQV